MCLSNKAIIDVFGTKNSMLASLNVNLGFLNWFNKYNVPMAVILQSASVFGCKQVWPHSLHLNLYWLKSKRTFLPFSTGWWILLTVLSWILSLLEWQYGHSLEVIFR